MAQRRLGTRSPEVARRLWDVEPGSLRAPELSTPEPPRAIKSAENLLCQSNRDIKKPMISSSYKMWKKCFVAQACRDVRAHTKRHQEC